MTFSGHFGHFESFWGDVGDILGFFVSFCGDSGVSLGSFCGDFVTVL